MQNIIQLGYKQICLNMPLVCCGHETEFGLRLTVNWPPFFIVEYCEIVEKWIIVHFRVNTSRRLRKQFLMQQTSVHQLIHILCKLQIQVAQ